MFKEDHQLGLNVAPTAVMGITTKANPVSKLRNQQLPPRFLSTTLFSCCVFVFVQTSDILLLWRTEALKGSAFISKKQSWSWRPTRSADLWTARASLTKCERWAVFGSLYCLIVMFKRWLRAPVWSLFGFASIIMFSFCFTDILWDILWNVSHCWTNFSHFLHKGDLLWSPSVHTQYYQTHLILNTHIL